MSRRQIVLAFHDLVECELAAQALRKRGDEAWCASGGLHAIELCLRLAPDVLVVETQLAQISGWHVVALLRQQRSADRIAILMMGATDADLARATAAESGIDDFILRPSSPDELGPRIDGAVESRRRRR